jgi:hypothetical protein
MIGNPLGAAARPVERSWLPPRSLLAGMAAAVLADVLAMAFPDQFIPVRIVVILTALVLALVGVNYRLRYFVEDLEARGTTAAQLATASFVVLLAYLATSEEWDTFRMVLGVFVALGLVGAVLVLLPQLVRRTLIVLLVLFHFGGILTAVFSVTPPSGVSCWMTSTLWTYVYRPYLQFMYLNNAYHFYSPEPGASTQMWFRLTFEDPKVPPRWVQIPRRQDFHSKLLYQRCIAMTESTTTTRSGYPVDFLGPRGKLMRRYEERTRIPYHPELQIDKGPFAAPDLSQYREPNEITSKKYIASYARHVANDPEYRDPERPDVPVKTVKVYRVLHSFLTPKEMGEGMDPEAPSKLLPVYMGEFDAEGTLLDPGDPLLYWVVPIFSEPGPNGDLVLKNYVAVHAGSAPPFLTDK